MLSWYASLCWYNKKNLYYLLHEKKSFKIYTKVIAFYSFEEIKRSI